MNAGCALCNGLGKIKEYGDTWPCPSCNPPHNFKSVCGLRYTDWDGNIFQSWQMVSESDGRAYAILDFANNTETRFLFADSVANEASDWRSNLRTQFPS